MHPGFIGQTPPPGGAPLRLETRTEAFVRACFARPRPPSVILTGNAGDGKACLSRIGPARRAPWDGGICSFRGECGAPAKELGLCPTNRSCSPVFWQGFSS